MISDLLSLPGLNARLWKLTAEAALGRNFRILFGAAAACFSIPVIPELSLCEIFSPSIIHGFIYSCVRKIKLEHQLAPASFL
jgi:hypothetical protein